MINIKNLKILNDLPIDVDYNHMDEEGGILLNTNGVIESIENLGLNLQEGNLVWISDTELEYIAVIIKRRGLWVAITINGTREDL